MEVFIRHVPPREVESSLESFFGEVLSRLSIEDWMCQKIPRKPFMKLIFLRSGDGLRFLNLHGNNLTFKGRLLDCRRSRELDAFSIRSLEMDKIARAKDGTTRAKLDTAHSTDSRTLHCTSISCGIWEYTQSGVIFLPFFTLEKAATIMFKSRAIVVETEISQRLEIFSQTVESVVWESSAIDSLTVTLREAPRISVCPDGLQTKSLGALFETLFVDNDDGPDRNRVPGLDKYHEEIAGSCLVYRFIISKGSGLKDPSKNLSLTRGLPSMVRRNIITSQPTVPYRAQLRNLLQHLSPMPGTFTLPFGIRFQLQKLAQNGYLSPLKIVDLLPELKEMHARSGSRVCVSAIRRLSRQIPYAGPDTEAKHFDLRHLTTSLRRIECELKLGGVCPDEPMPSDQVVLIHKATVTPSGIYLYGPETECNNRVLRKYARYHDFFLRVQFSDEDGMPVQYNRDISNKSVFERFKTILDKGFLIAGQHFSFLGFSHSSLRSQSCWFMAPFIYNGTLTYYKEVIKELGNFSLIRTPARCAARIGQAFSDTRDAITFAPGIVKDNKELQDIERNGRVFSDGVGTISQGALDHIWAKLPPSKMRPTVLQIRYQGAKGVIALDSRLKGESIFIRPSMTKFLGSTSNDVEICTTASKATEMRLNEQLIKILEDMGVKPQFFLDLQAQEIEKLRSITSSTRTASNFLESQSIGEKIHLPEFLRKLLRLQLSFQDDSFLTDVVETAVLIQLRTLKYKARIPVKDGFTLIGIMDETGILEEGQIFCIIDMGGRGRVITGERVIISRSPALHPGDAQLATAVSVPENSPLMQLRNCICFSQKGPRDLPSKLSGGDLDGDTFHIIFDPKARTREPFAPADYTKQAARELNRPVEREDMTDFFVDFMETDQLGRICNMHKMLADQSPKGVNDARCIKLAEMASTAVDFSKTGIPVNMKEMPKHSRIRPHFMAPGPYVEIMKDKPISFEETGNPSDGDADSTGYKYYPSDKILGKLFDAVDEKEIFQRMRDNSFQHALHRTDRGWDHNWSLLKGVWDHTQEDCSSLSAKWKCHLDRARGIRDEEVFLLINFTTPLEFRVKYPANTKAFLRYEDSLLEIMFEFGPRPHVLPLSEVEVFIGNILGKTGALTSRQRELCISMKERFSDVLFFTVQWIRDADPEDVLGVSAACLWVALNEKQKVWEDGKNRKMEGLRSFGYVAAAVCLREFEQGDGC